jgi:SAM-dependent methyltransferase
MHETHHYNTSWEKVRRVFPSGGPFTVLDLGCGDGRVVESLLQSHDVLGLDTDAHAVREAYTRGLHAVKGSIENVFPFPDASCDIVLALDILEHVADMGFVFSQIKRVLKPEGSLIISMPNHFDVRTRLDILRGKGIIKWSQQEYEKKSWEYAHIRFWTLKELGTMLRDYGFYPELWQFNFMSGGMVPTRLVPRWKRRWLVSRWPGLWSGKFVVRCRMRLTSATKTVVIDETPKDF